MKEGIILYRNTSAGLLAVAALKNCIMVLAGYEQLSLCTIFFKKNMLFFFT